MKTKGGGELGICGSPPVADAIYNATGVRVRTVTLDKLLVGLPKIV